MTPDDEIARDAGGASGTHTRPAPPLAIRRLGRVGYHAAWRAMREFTDARSDDSADEAWLVEHPPVYTLGIAGRRAHLLRDNGIDVVNSDRGGQVTYHGPGQLVVYLLVDLRRLGLGVRELVRCIERAVIKLLDGYAIPAHARADAPGVYVDRDGVEAKVAALGLKVRRGCTYHGVAINVDVDLRPFADVDPCGYPGLAVTRLADLGVTDDVAAVGERVVPLLAREIGLSVAPAPRRDR